MRVNRPTETPNLLQLRERIQSSYDSNRKLFSEVPHPKQYWAARGHTYGAYIEHMVKFANEKNLELLEVMIQHLIGLEK